MKNAPAKSFYDAFSVTIRNFYTSGSVFLWFCFGNGIIIFRETIPCKELLKKKNVKNVLIDDKKGTLKTN